MTEKQITRLDEPSAYKRPAKRRRSRKELAELHEQRASEREKALAEYNAAAQAAIDRIARLKAARQKAASAD